MASTQTVALDFLTKLEADLNAHNNGGTASIYNFAGYVGGQPAGITKTNHISLNRGGQILQFLAGYYTSTADASIRARIATAAGKVYKIFNGRPVFTSTNFVGDTHGANFATSGQFPNDPSGPLMALGLMMIDKQGVIDHANFSTAAGVTAATVRTVQIPKQAKRLNAALDIDSFLVPSLRNGDSYTWATQKMAKYALNGTALTIAVLSLYVKMYGDNTYVSRYTDSYYLLRNVSTKFGTTFTAGTTTVLSATAAGQNSGAALCLAIGGEAQSRGAFPSVGYNAIVGLALSLQAFAEKVTTSTKFNQMQTLINGHVLQIDALKIQNYYRDRVASDGFLFELGAHRNFAGDASRFKEDWRADLIKRGHTNVNFAGSAQFDVLLTKSTYPGMTSYSYSMMWTLPTHSLYTNIANKFAYGASGKTSNDINWSAVGSSASVAQAFAAAGEPAMGRVVSGLGALLMNGVTTIS